MLLPRGLEAKFAVRPHHGPYGTPLFRRFRRLVGWVIDRRWWVIGAALLALAGATFTQVPKQFFPQSERPELMVELRGPEGASLASSLAGVEAVERLIAGRPEVAQAASFVGAGAPRFYLALNPMLPNDNFGLVLIVTKGNAEREALRRFLIDHFAQEEGPMRAGVLQLDFAAAPGARFSSQCRLPTI